jgi:hypothetical protein
MIMAKRNLWIPRQRDRVGTNSAVEDFLANGGEIIKLKDDDGTYNKNEKKTKARLGGGFNPFAKDVALRKTDGE